MEETPDKNQENAIEEAVRKFVDEKWQGQEPDIDELARKILPEIKRRLAIDWERGRGRIR